MNAAHRIASTALVLALGFGARGVHAEGIITPEAQGYFRNGVELLQADTPNYQDAYYQFKLAYEKSNSWKVLGNLGLCALKLERDGEALAYYDDYLKLGGRNVDRAEREAIERDLLLARGNGATVEFTASEEGELIDTRTTSGERCNAARSAAPTSSATNGSRLKRRARRTFAPSPRMTR